MSEMVERIARAICAANGVDPDIHLRKDGWPQWMSYKEYAKAAIEAMREPTDDMKKAVHATGGTEWLWPTMIDATVGKRDP